MGATHLEALSGGRERVGDAHEYSVGAHSIRSRLGMKRNSRKVGGCNDELPVRILCLVRSARAPGRPVKYFYEGSWREDPGKIG